MQPSWFQTKSSRVLVPGGALGAPRPIFSWNSELREARSTGENVFAFRDEGRYTIQHLSSDSSFEHRAAHVFLSPPCVRISKWSQ